MKALLLPLLVTAVLGANEPPKGLRSGDWSSLRAAYEAGRSASGATSVRESPGALSVTSIAKSSFSAPGGTDLAFSAPGAMAMGPAGVALLETGLVGAGASKGKNRGMYSTLTGPVDLLMQKGAVLSGVLGLPTNAKVSALLSPVHNRNVAPSLFQAAVPGSRLLFADNGSVIYPILRTGQPLSLLSNAVPSVFREVLQAGDTQDKIVIGYTLKVGAGGVLKGNDTGILILNNQGTITQVGAREGNTGGFSAGASFSGTLGTFGRATPTFGTGVAYLAKLIQPLVKPLDAVFFINTFNSQAVPVQGNDAPGTSTGVKFGVFKGITQMDDVAIIRSTLTGSPTSANEGIWNSGGGLHLRKGQDIGGGVKVAKIIRVWANRSDQVLVHVQLTGTNVKPSNNQALLLVQNPIGYQILFRTGEPAPGIGGSVTVARIQAVDVDPHHGHYVILASLKGTSASSNQALWQGRSTLGDNAGMQSLRLPGLVMRKGEIYQSAVTLAGSIRGITLKPVIDPSGVGGRGLGQVINSTGQVVLTLTGDRNIKETVRIDP